MNTHKRYNHKPDFSIFQNQLSPNMQNPSETKPGFFYIYLSMKSLLKKRRFQHLMSLVSFFLILFRFPLKFYQACSDETCSQGVCTPSPTSRGGFKCDCPIGLTGIGCVDLIRKRLFIQESTIFAILFD